MKKIFLLIILGLTISSVLFAQQVPQGMKYQAVARNSKGEILANEKIVLKISLSSKQRGATIVYYSDVHNVLTNDLGLFSLVVGEGITNKKNFNEIPWSTEEIWMDVEIADKTKDSFTSIGSNKL